MKRYKQSMAYGTIIVALSYQRQGNCVYLKWTAAWKQSMQVRLLCQHTEQPCTNATSENKRLSSPSLPTNRIQFQCLHYCFQSQFKKSVTPIRPWGKPNICKNFPSLPQHGHEGKKSSCLGLFYFFTNMHFLVKRRNQEFSVVSLETDTWVGKWERSWAVRSW